MTQEKEKVFVRQLALEQLTVRESNDATWSRDEKSDSPAVLASLRCAAGININDRYETCGHCCCCDYY